MACDDVGESWSWYQSSWAIEHFRIRKSLKPVDASALWAPAFASGNVAAADWNEIRTQIKKKQIGTQIIIVKNDYS